MHAAIFADVLAGEVLTGSYFIKPWMHANEKTQNCIYLYVKGACMGASKNQIFVQLNRRKPQKFSTLLCIYASCLCAQCYNSVKLHAALASITIAAPLIILIKVVVIKKPTIYLRMHYAWWLNTIYIARVVVRESRRLPLHDHITKVWSNLAIYKLVIVIPYSQ